MTTPLLPQITVKRRDGSEPLHKQRQPLGPTLLDFWRWSSSDLVSNTCRSVLAEYLVGVDLGLVDTYRAPWHPFDFETRSGIKVEVKSAAYLQRWQQQKLSSICFQVPRTSAEDPVTAQFAAERRRQADVYVFALLAHEDKGTLDPLDVAQWKFFVLPSAILDRQLGAKTSISLARLQALGAREVAFGSIGSAIEQVLARTADAPPQAAVITVDSVQIDGGGAGHGNRGFRDMMVFEKDDNGYLAWTRANRDGFVLARRSKQEAVLHAVPCVHLDDDGSYQRTKKPKVCSADSSELRRWARDNGVTVRTCSDC